MFNATQENKKKLKHPNDLKFIVTTRKSIRLYIAVIFYKISVMIQVSPPKNL